jgi:hypothetical protein
MRNTLAAIILATAALSSTPALADGPPGACDCYAPPPPAAAPAGSHWYDRIGVGLHITGMSVSPATENRDERVEPTDYGGGGLHLTYRLGARWELEGSSDHVENEETGQSLEGGSLGVRFHITPHRRWDFYVLGGLGGMTDENEQHLGTVHAGIGVERRFNRIGLAAEWRAMGLQPHVEEEGAAASTMPVPDEAAAEDGLGAGVLRVAASYHF